MFTSQLDLAEHSTLNQTDSWLLEGHCHSRRLPEAAELALMALGVEPPNDSSGMATSTTPDGWQMSVPIFLSQLKFRYPHKAIILTIHWYLMFHYNCIFDSMCSRYLTINLTLIKISEPPPLPPVRRRRQRQLC